MIRLIKVLAATALMMVLMATTVSPALADPPEKWGVLKKEEAKKGEKVTGIGHGLQLAEGENAGFHCGTEDDDPPRSECG